MAALILPVGIIDWSAPHYAQPAQEYREARLD